MIISFKQFVHFKSKLIIPRDPNGFGIPDYDSCWLYNDNWFTDKDGYGIIHLNQIKFRAHVLALRIACGTVLPNGDIKLCEVPEQAPYVLHACDTPACCNPYKCLSFGTNQENQRQAVERGLSKSGLDCDHARSDLIPHVPLIKELCNQGVHQRVVAKQFGCAQTTIGRIVRKEGAWADI